MEVFHHYFDTILVSLSLFLLIGYHVCLWHAFKTNPSHTTLGIDSTRRRIWFLEVNEGDEKKAMLGIQSLRNTQMVATSTASIATLVSLALATLANNAFDERRLFVRSPFFGSQSDRMFALKFGLASVPLSFSALCSFMATGFLTDTIFLINASADFSPSRITQTVALNERGYMLAFMGTRLLYVSFPLLVWLFGPVPVALSSLVLVWWHYQCDFAAKSNKTRSESKV